jgi:hypothetical protein
VTLRLASEPRQTPDHMSQHCPRFALLIATLLIHSC